MLFKNTWALSYGVDGKHVDDFPMGFYAGLLLIGAACWVGLSLVSQRLKRWR